MLTYSGFVTLYLAYLGFVDGSSAVMLWPAVAVHLILTVLLTQAASHGLPTRAESYSGASVALTLPGNSSVRRNEPTAISGIGPPRRFGAARRGRTDGIRLQVAVVTPPTRYRRRSESWLNAVMRGNRAANEQRAASYHHQPCFGDRQGYLNLKGYGEFDAAQCADVWRLSSRGGFRSDRALDRTDPFIAHGPPSTFAQTMLPSWPLLLMIEG